jgi:hypothetical protein
MIITRILDMLNHQEIKQRLWEQLDQARVEQLAAAARFELLLKESPAAVPHPDGSLRIQQAGRDSREALQRYMHVLKQFTDFTLTGTIPADMLPAERSQRAAG